MQTWVQTLCVSAALCMRHIFIEGVVFCALWTIWIHSSDSVWCSPVIPLPIFRRFSPLRVLHKWEELFSSLFTHFFCSLLFFSFWGETLTSGAYNLHYSALSLNPPKGLCTFHLPSLPVPLSLLVCLRTWRWLHFPSYAHLLWSSRKIHTQVCRWLSSPGSCDLKKRKKIS